MSQRWAVLAGGLILLAAACSEGSGSEPVTLRVSTPTLAPAKPAGQSPPPPNATPTPIVPEFMLSSGTVHVGGTLLVSVTGDVQAGTATLLGRKHTLTRGARSMYTFIGVGVLDEPGAATLSIAIETSNGSRGELGGTIVILPTAWTVDEITFEPGQAETLLEPAVVEAERKLLESIYATETTEKLWDGAWLVPVEGPVTGVFGEQRSINGSVPSGHHGGTDLSAAQGTAVRATNAGRVVMVKDLAVRGKMVIIDHGGGLLSGYGHMSSFAVTEGQRVAAGEPIGAVGNTGLSTGAHLHWEMSVDGVLVDAWRFADGTNGF